MNWRRIIERLIVVLVLAVIGVAVKLWKDVEDMKTKGYVPIPSKAISAFNLKDCPSGWSEVPATGGRYIVGLAPGGTLAEAVGHKLTPGESREVGRHAHTMTKDDHAHILNRADGTSDAGRFVAKDYTGGVFLDEGEKDSEGNSGVASYEHKHTVEHKGTYEGTNAPYIQYLFCQKD